MRLSEFSPKDPAAAELAAELTRALLSRRVATQQVRIDALRAHLDLSGAELALPRADRDLVFEDRPREAERPPAGLDAIYGSGLVHHHGSTAPVLLVDEDVVDGEAIPGQLTRLAEHPELSRLARRLTAEDSSGHTLVLPVPEPLPYFGPAERVDGPGTTGTVGAAVQDQQGRRFLTTAGHVAAVGANVTDPAGAHGVVVWSHNPAATAGPHPVADIALIAPDTGAVGVGAVAITGSSASGPGDGIEVHGAFTLKGISQTMGFVAALFVPSMAAMWAQLYFTTTAASVPGDSGAPVLAAGTDKLVGHLVGGAPGLTSYIQSIDVQLAATNCTLG